jgi:hypothetical protein
MLCHRMYDAEVVDLSPEVSFLIVVPRAESACAVPGQTEALLQRGDLIALPVQVFEMVHLGTYQREVVSRYSRLSCILELDTILAHHSHREVCSYNCRKFHWILQNDRFMWSLYLMFNDWRTSRPCL